jgi:hypothetical protein
MPKFSSAKTSTSRKKTVRSKDVDGGRLRIGGDGNAIGIVALSPSNPLKAMVEFLHGDPLISRAQAKRVLARVELFRTAVFDFSGVSSIGQAFADEIFRVFANAHPGIRLHFIHADATIGQMISRARSTAPRHSRLKDAAPPTARTRS